MITMITQNAKRKFVLLGSTDPLGTFGDDADGDDDDNDDDDDEEDDDDRDGDDDDVGCRL